jgi:PQQ-dependent dehydrogenase (s-GDH family)
MNISPSWTSSCRSLALVFTLACPACGGDEAVNPRDAAPADASATFDAAPPARDASMDASPDTATLDAVTPEAATLAAPDAAAPSLGSFAMRVVRAGLDAPWEVRWGPDDQLWISERTGKRVVRVDPASGALSVALEVADAYRASAQDGVLGLALHPLLLLGADYVYLAYSYDADASDALDRRAKIVRYRYQAGALLEPTVLIDALPASSDHNAGRLVFGPDATLYYSIGDQGKNQFDLKCLPIRAQELPSQDQVDAQDWSRYEGKILRVALDGGIPDDNPVLAGVRSHIYSYGHRNPQGLAFTADGGLYASEQGPKTDDELNIILPGRNYGWPRVAGARDDLAYVYGDWSAASDCPSLPYSDYELAPSVPQQSESSFSEPDLMPPLRTFYTVPSDHDFHAALCADSPYICWPTIAPSSLDVYLASTSGVPGWDSSLLITSLKDGAVYRVKLGAWDTAEPLFKTTNRYRDLAVAPDGRTFYVVTDTGGDTRAPDGSPTQALQHPGAILEFRYTP